MTAPAIHEVDPDRLDELLDDYVAELHTGSGALVLRRAFTPRQVADARQRIIDHSSADGEKVTHFHGAHEEAISLQRRVWNLLAKGEVFEEMAQHAVVCRIVGAFLGAGFIMGSIAANRILPGGPGQEPHIDYPYWDLYDRESFPAGINASVPLNCQATIMLDTFDEETGATAFAPASHTPLLYPADESEFHRRAIRQRGEPGDVVIFSGANWHCAMPNRSARDRIGVLIQYLPKFVKPMEDMAAQVPVEVIERATPMLRQLLGFDYPYPQVLDDADAVNAEGQAGRGG